MEGSHSGRVRLLGEQLGLEKGLEGSNPSPSANQDFASQRKPPRFARRPFRIEFWGQKRIGGFVWGTEKFLIIIFVLNYERLNSHSKNTKQSSE